MPLVSVSSTPTLLTPTDVTGEVMFQVPSRVMIARGGSSAPGDNADWWSYEAGQGDRGDLDTLFPGGSGARLWARTTRDNAMVRVSYA